MDIEEEAKKLGDNVMLRYAAIIIGLALALISEGCQTWKRSSVEDARGNVASMNLKIQRLRDKADDTDSAEKKKKYREEADKMRDEKLADAQKKVESKSAKAQNGAFLISMIAWAGTAIAAFGVVLIAFVGTGYEKAGALVAIGMIVSRLM